MRTFRFIPLIILLFGLLEGISQNRITGYSWWFDGDDVTEVVLTDPAPVFTLEEAFPVTGLETGLHTFHIRFRDDSARYSGS